MMNKQYTIDQSARDEIKRLYHAVLRIRRIEEKVAEIYPSDKIKSPVHLSIGQEAISVAVCDTLTLDDAVAITYRGHAAYLAKGGSLKAMMAEMFGKGTGCAGGKGGSMHLIAPEVNVLGASAVVGSHIPMAAGYAMAFKMRKKSSVVVCFLGDGATEEGCFAETLNFASLHHLPILFVCENNAYAIHEPLHKRWARADICARVETYGIPTVRFEKQDLLAIRAQARTMVARMRAGDGPQFMECLTYRWKEHVGPAEDFAAGYRSVAEALPWMRGDTVAELADILDAATREAIESEILSEIEEAVAFAENSPPPTPEMLLKDVYAGEME